MPLHFWIQGFSPTSLLLPSCARAVYYNQALQWGQRGQSLTKQSGRKDSEMCLTSAPGEPPEKEHYR